MSTTTEVDVLMVSDLRLPGGTTASIAEEVRAQAAPGHRTGLIHVNSRLSRKRDLGIDARLGRCVDEGMATLVLRGICSRTARGVAERHRLRVKA